MKPSAQLQSAKVADFSILNITTIFLVRKCKQDIGLLELSQLGLEGCYKKKKNLHTSKDHVINLPPHFSVTKSSNLPRVKRLPIFLIPAPFFFKMSGQESTSLPVTGWFLALHSLRAPFFVACMTLAFTTIIPVRLIHLCVWRVKWWDDSAHVHIHTRTTQKNKDNPENNIREGDCRSLFYVSIEPATVATWPLL